MSESKQTGVSREEALKFLGIAVRNWSHVPPLSEDDVGDVATALLWFVNSRLSPPTREEGGRE